MYRISLSEPNKYLNIPLKSPVLYFFTLMKRLCDQVPDHNQMHPSLMQAVVRRETLKLSARGGDERWPFQSRPSTSTLDPAS